MISQLTGTIRHLTSDKAVIEVGGVGYLLSITPRTSAHLAMGATLTLHTSLIVREDSMNLFGFIETSDRDLYEILQTVTGIGPKVALAITGALSPSDLASAVAREDLATIEKIPGIGKKGAQRLVLELKGKILTQGTYTSVVAHNSPVRDQLLAALTGLGFTPKESDTAINSTFAHINENGGDSDSMELSELLRLTLQSGKR